jgi:hypothetical protein
LEESKNHNFAETPAKTQNFPQTYVLFSTTGKLFEKMILRTSQKHTEKKTY